MGFFLFDYNSGGQQIYKLYAKESDNKNVEKEFPYGLKTKNYTLIKRNEFWPNGWQIANQTFKPCAYWPQKYYFLYIMNGKTSEDKPVLATNSLLNNDWTHSWTYNNIAGFEGKVFTSAFWWIKTDKIYVIAENRTANRSGFVYEFDEINLSNPFKPIVSLIFISNSKKQ